MSIGKASAKKLGETRLAALKHARHGSILSSICCIRQGKGLITQKKGQRCCCQEAALCTESL